MDHRPRSESGVTVPVVQAVLNAAQEAARELYAAEVHRQCVGWDDYCTAKLVATQHALGAAVAVYRATLNPTPCPECNGEILVAGQFGVDPLGIKICPACGGSGATPTPEPAP
jgi:hypothetical protein